jgi:predicted metalloprotease with PDZ domain
MSVASITELDASYCLPVPALARVRDDLLFSGHIIHSWMGFEVAEQLGAEMENAVYLSTVIEDAPAGQAGLLEGDRLISIAGHPIQDVSDVPRPARVPIVRQADAQEQSDTTAEPQPVAREATTPVVADPVDSSASH